VSKQGLTCEPPETSPDVRTIMLSVGAWGTVCGARLNTCVVVLWPRVSSRGHARRARSRRALPLAAVGKNRFCACGDTMQCSRFSSPPRSTGTTTQVPTVDDQER
jgi:hypothetical protein